MEKVKHHRLSADERPLFPVMHQVQKTKKDKANERASIKKSVRQIRDEYNL